MISGSSIKVLAVLLVVLSCRVPALAQGAEFSLGMRDHDAELPIEVTSAALTLDQEDGVANFSGQVIIRQGSMIMTCGNARVEYDVDPETGKERITAIHMSDNVTFASDSETAEAEQAVYSLPDNRLVMSGNVLIVQGTTAISADSLEYDLESGSGRAGGEVRTTLRLNENR